MRRVVPHHDHRRMILPADQQARFFPDRKRDRAEHAVHPLTHQPAFGRGQKRARRIFVLCIEIAEKPGSGTKPLFGGHGEREFINMRRDPPDGLGAAPRDEQLHSGMAEKRVPGRIDQFQLFGTDLRHEMFHPRRKGTAQIDKIGAPALAGDRLDAYFRAALCCIRHAAVPMVVFDQSVCVAPASLTQACRSLLPITLVWLTPAFGVGRTSYFCRKWPVNDCAPDD